MFYVNIMLTTKQTPTLYMQKTFYRYNGILINSNLSFIAYDNSAFLFSLIDFFDVTIYLFLFCIFVSKLE